MQLSKLTAAAVLAVSMLSACTLSNNKWRPLQKSPSFDS